MHRVRFIAPISVLIATGCLLVVGCHGNAERPAVGGEDTTDSSTSAQDFHPDQSNAINNALA